MNTVLALYIATLFVLLGVAVNSNATDLYFEVDMNTGHNSNVFLSADEDIIVSDESQSSPQQDMQTQLSIMGSYEFFDGANSDAKIMVDYFKESFNDNDLESTITSVSLPFTYYMDQYRLRVTPAVMQYSLSGENVLNYTSSRFDLTRKISNKTLGDTKVGMQYGYTQKSPQQISYADYEGDSQNVKAYVNFKNGSSSVKFNVNVFGNNYQDEYSSNDGYYVKAKYNQYYQNSGFALSAKVKSTQYIVDPLLSDEAREDIQLTLSYLQDYYVSDITQLYFNSEYTNNKSNINFSDENYNYDQWVNTLGMRFVF